MGYWKCPRCGGNSSFKQREQRFTNNLQQSGQFGVRNVRVAYCHSCIVVKMDYRLYPWEWKIIGLLIFVLIVIPNVLDPIMRQIVTEIFPISPILYLCANLVPLILGIIKLRKKGRFNSPKPFISFSKTPFLFMNYRWKRVRPYFFLVSGLLIINLIIGTYANSVSENMNSEKSSTVKQSTKSKKVISSKNKGSKSKENNEISQTPQSSEDSQTDQKESKSEYSFDWPPTSSTQVSGESGATIFGNWQQVPGNENWYYLTEDEWVACPALGGYCQLTWWLSDRECTNPIPTAEFIKSDGQIEINHSFAGNYSKPYIAIGLLYVLIGSSESTYRQNKVIPEKDKYTIKSISCN